MSNYRDKSFEEEMLKDVAEEVQKLSNKTSLITLTGAKAGRDRSDMLIYVSVLPTEKAPEVMLFLERNISDIRHNILKKRRAKHVPFFTFRLNSFGE
ncbi:MAG TPA: ribosome-binding factor A [Candidatus Paceibacterota bacterium]